MKYINTYENHSSYETELNGGGVDINLPNVSYCKDVKDVHYTPYNLVRFYVGDITGTTPQTVKIYTDRSTSIPIQVSDSNKWYSYLLPKDKGLYMIQGDSIKKVVVKADIINDGNKTITPRSTVEASFKGSNVDGTTMRNMFSFSTSLTSLDLSDFNTSNVTNMYGMFYGCNGLTSLDVSSFDTRKVTNMRQMFRNCSSLKSLDLSNFNTNNVTDMSQMFDSCISLAYLDLSGWDTSNAEATINGMFSMFYGCSALKKIRMKGCSQDTINTISGLKPSTAKIVTE